MASRRKGWESLSPTYRARLERANIDRSAYERGESLLSGARGHSFTPERLTGYQKRAMDLGLWTVAPEFEEFAEAMTEEERIAVARDYVLGFMRPGKTNRVRATARLDFFSWLMDMRGGSFSREDWQAYKAAYNLHFGSRES